MSQISQMDLIKAEIEYGSRGTGNKEITQNILKQWRGSKKIIDMQEAYQYYMVDNTTIQNKTRSYVDNEGNLVINNNLSNVKSKTAKYRNNVLDKANFALNKPFTISCDNDKYKQAWDEFLDEDTRDIIARIGKQAINKGICYAYVWIDEQGNLQIIDNDSETIYPAWSDKAHKDLDAIVRDYTITQYINQTPRDIRKVEFWDRKIVQKFIDYSMGESGTSGDLVDDNFENDDELAERASVIQTHMVGKKGEGISWNKVPFIPFKGNEDELPELNICRDDIDNYDLTKSKGLDSVLDDIDAVLIVEDISAELEDLSKARKMVQNSRILSVESGGNAHFEKVDANIDAVRDELDLIKKDMIHDTKSVDVTTIEFGSNPSGKALRMFFIPLNQWTNGFEKEFRVFMKNLKYFFDLWLSWKGGFGSFEELQKQKVTFTLDRDLIVDETDIIDNIVKLEGELSQETRDELNPYVESHEKEEKRREEDRKAEQERQELFQLENENEEAEDMEGFEKTEAFIKKSTSDNKK